MAQPGEVVRVRRRAGLDLDPDNVAIVALDDDVDFALLSVAIMEELDGPVGPVGLAEELHRDEALQQGSCDRAVLGNSLPGDREVPVQDMSQGQRHQLFLGLRLACLERHFEHNEPMPLILDDLLVQLDDVSARAALEILAELARVTQVVFFTHPDHLVRMARSAVPADLLVEREISETARPVLKAA